MLIRDALLLDGRRVDLSIDRGVIADVRAPGDSVEGDVPARGGDVLDLDGRLLLAGLVEPHAHLDKALTADLVDNPTGSLDGAIEGWLAAVDAGAITHDDMVERFRAALDRLVLNGVTAVRTHVNCGVANGLANVHAALEAVSPYRDLVHVEFAALTMPPVTGRDGAGNRAFLRAAIEAGVELVGGCPHLEPDGVGSIDVFLDVAAETGSSVDLHVDETLEPTMLTLRDLAGAVARRGVEGTVTASHCVSLGVQPPDVQCAVAAEVAEAGIAVITLPQTNLYLQGRDRPVSTPRGLTAIRPLLDAGAVVAAGGDNVQDPFNLVGRSDPLETAALLVMAAHLSPAEAYEMVSNAGRRALGLAPVRFEVGDPADFVVVDAPSLRAAIADAPADRMTIHAGRVVAESTRSTVIHR